LESKPNPELIVKENDPPEERVIPFFYGDDDMDNVELDPDDEKALNEAFSPGKRVVTATGKVYRIDEQGIPRPVDPYSDQERIRRILKDVDEPFNPEHQMDAEYGDMIQAIEYGDNKGNQYALMAKTNSIRKAGHDDWHRTKLWLRISHERDPRRLRSLLSKLLGQCIDAQDVSTVLRNLEQAI